VQFFPLQMLQVLQVLQVRWQMNWCWIHVENFICNECINCF
jgi:hypothetical protein